MSDVGLFLTEDGVDLQLELGDLKRDEGLETAVLISLFTDGRASFENLPTFEGSRRGWWGDLISEVEGSRIGSELWRFYREKITSKTANTIKKIAEDSLQWLVDDGVASQVSVQTSIVGLYEIGLDIQIQRPERASQRYSFVWDGQELRR